MKIIFFHNSSDFDLYPKKLNIEMHPNKIKHELQLNLLQLRKIPNKKKYNLMIFEIYSNPKLFKKIQLYLQIVVILNEKLAHIKKRFVEGSKIVHIRIQVV